MIFIFYIILLIILFIFSFGFVDRNLPFLSNNVYRFFQAPLSAVVYEDRLWAGLIYVALVLGLFAIYIFFLKEKNPVSLLKPPWKIFALTVFILFFAFPAFSYDVFNYMLTAKMTYFYKENPYLVMPIEIPNEPWLAFTRAANKVALYGPVWLGLTWIPFTMGLGNIPFTIYSFKLLVFVFYCLMLYLIYLNTRCLKNVIFFGLNPLILTEVLVSAHNDVVMMVFVTLALMSLGSADAKKKIFGFTSYIFSIFIKGATIILLPVFLFFHRLDAKKRYRICYWLMMIIFLLSPIREEMYPWYAVWFLTFAAFLPFSRQNFIHGFTIALTFGLSLRHLPYILTREYGGIGPFFRTVSTLIPPLFYFFYFVLYYQKNSLKKLND